LSEVETAKRADARRLRHEGRSIKEIAALIDVSQSSVSLWVRDVVLHPSQLDALAVRAQERRVRSRSRTWRGRRMNAQQDGRLTARRGEALHASGCMLFWAEGSRHRNAAKFSNSDPAMMAFFMRFLRAYFEIDEARCRVWCNLHADHMERQRAVEDFWLATLNLPRACLTKSTVNVYSRATKQKRTNMLPYGTCRVTVHDTAIVQHIYGAIQEYSGFDREEWLDCLPRAS
jgi:hypothetical protein